MTTKTTTAELLAALNNHRLAAGKPALKAWKESRAKLEAAINKANVERFEGTETPAPELTATTTKSGNVKIKATKTTSASGDFFREHGINAKVGRARMRRAGFAAPYSLADLKKTFDK